MTKYFGEDWQRYQYADSAYADSYDLLRGRRRLAANLADSDLDYLQSDMPDVTFQSWAFGQRPCHPFYVWAQGLGKDIPSYIYPFLRVDGGIEDNGQPKFPVGALTLEVCRDLGVHPANLDPEYLDPVARGFRPLHKNLVEALTLLVADDDAAAIDRELALDVLATEENFCKSLIRQQSPTLLVLSMVDEWAADRQAGVFLNGMTRGFTMSPKLRTMFAFADRLPYDSSTPVQIRALKKEIDGDQQLLKSVSAEAREAIHIYADRLRVLGKALFGDKSDTAFTNILGYVKKTGSTYPKAFWDDMRYILVSEPMLIAPTQRHAEREAKKLGYADTAALQDAYIDCFSAEIAEFGCQEHVKKLIKQQKHLGVQLQTLTDTLGDGTSLMQSYVQAAYENLKLIDPDVTQKLTRAKGQVDFSVVLKNGP